MIFGISEERKRKEKFLSPTQGLFTKRFSSRESPGFGVNCLKAKQIPNKGR
jgi:hypothetical protein